MTFSCHTPVCILEKTKRTARSNSEIKGTLALVVFYVYLLKKRTMNNNATAPLSPSLLPQTSFFVSVSNHIPEIVSEDGAIRIPLNSLDALGLIRAKNMAHDQYVNAMMKQEDDLDMHRATLNFLSRTVEKVGNPLTRPHASRLAAKPSRKSRGSKAPQSSTAPQSSRAPQSSTALNSSTASRTSKAA